MARKKSEEKSPLVEAVRTGNRSYLAEMLQRTSKIDQEDGLGYTALLVAVARFDAEAVRLLLEAGADPRAPARALANYRAYERLGEAAATPKGPNTVFHALGYGGAYEGADVRGVIAALIERGLDINAVNEDGSTPLHIAVQAAPEVEPGPQTDAISALLARGANLHARDRKGRSPLAHASWSHGMRRLLDAGADPSDGDLRFKRGDELLVLLRAGTNPKNQPVALSLAAGFGHKDAVDLLLEFGAPHTWEEHWIGPGGGGTFQKTALEAAAEKGHTGVAKRLIDAGTTNLEPALAAAAFGGHGSLVRLLLERGADPNGKPGFPHLCLVAEMGREDLVEQFLGAGADVEARDNDGNTALILAAKSGVVAAVRRLLDAGAERHAKNAEGSTAETAARKARVAPDLVVQFPGKYDHLQILRELKGTEEPAGQHISATPPAPSDGVLREGESVMHGTFGRGRVLSVAGTGDAASCTVEFEDHVRRKLRTRFLKRLA
jgi:ankyrin repeat protein